MTTTAWTASRRTRPRAVAHTEAVHIGRAAFLLLHVPLALAMDYYEPLATFHAAAAIAAATGIALAPRRGIEQVGYAAAYLTGAEVLWRMTGAAIPWEAGKYSLAVVLLLGLMARGRLDPAANRLALGYFVLLIPSTVLTVLDLDPGAARDQISFNMSGPFALAVSALFFSQVHLDAPRRQNLFAAVVAPALGIAAIAIMHTWTADVAFGRESNLVTSGGFGPNQVSAALGFAALAAFFLMLDSSLRLADRFVAGGAIVVLAVQSALTLSRGGLYTFAGAAIAAAFCTMRDRGARRRLLLTAAVFLALAHYVVLPQLDAFTGGALQNRFSDVGLTGRDRLVEADLEIWRSHPLFGVGPGLAKDHRPITVKYAAAHTEFSRMLAEHGSLGLLSLILLGIMLLRAAKLQETPLAMGVAAALVVWSVLFMANSGMRLAAPSLAAGLACAAFAEGMPDRLRRVQLPRLRRTVRVDR